MKLRWFTLILIVLFITISSPAYAHSGRTDGNGGHTDHSTGEYHYHHGYNDHQHYDIDGDGDIDCPYDFEDNIIRKDNSTSNSGNVSANNKENQNSENISNENKEEQENKTTSRDIIETILVAIIFGPLILCVALSVIAAVFEVIVDLIKDLKEMINRRR